ncbi:hypothetical protein HT665_00715 [Ursidibacter maritimus]|uniref:PilN domain-containing protein n=1 Tax=Ursidibacter maritimus TaxID=1331689 RepID=A0A949T3W3_9PAST|nr:hypothetical protein [Ursidibacter maritimus]KAE9540423.1 hypothetical protein A1D26_01690 [Ursidibacter maritimus]MBV6524719.1 hypothetical protein [Ursidibacter maritimus]MBV6525011.1 hypothetical protein [Ursidibacter maritimus]MBV6527213.1 hypothetical protein [Ursidibacter maritimus]MBV6530177.1 hypothetical protein [Ursidibacter maritimus]
MEWQGINLSGYNQEKWATENIRNLVKIMVTLIVSLLIGIVIIFEQLSLHQQIDIIKDQTAQQTHHLSQIREKIEKLKQQIISPNQSLSQKSIHFFVDYLKNFKAKGRLEMIQLSIDHNEMVKIFGKTRTQEEFILIEQQLKNLNIDYNITHLHNNKENLIEFQIHIDLKG